MIPVIRGPNTGTTSSTTIISPVRFTRRSVTRRRGHRRREFGRARAGRVLDRHGQPQLDAPVRRQRSSPPYEDLPKSVTDLIDDPFRSLAGELRRAGDFAKDTTPYSANSFGRISGAGASSASSSSTTSTGHWSAHCNWARAWTPVVCRLVRRCARGVTPDLPHFRCAMLGGGKSNSPVLEVRT